MPYFRHDDVELFYTDQGEGPVVLLLHGWGCDSHDWSWQIPALLDAYRVIAVDQRGHGRSSAPRGPYTPQVLADDAAALLRSLTTEPAAVVGHSMGTVVTSALALRHPETVSALVLVDPVYHAEDQRMVPMLEAMRGPEPAAVAAKLFGHAFYTDETPAFLPTWHTRRVLGTPDHVVSGCILGLFDGEQALGRAAVSSQALKLRKQPRLAVYADARAADQERALPVGPLDEIHTWQGAGHFLHQERPAEFNDLMMDWLARARANRS